MHEPVRVEVARDCDADDLAAYLGEHGFAARCGGGAVEVDYAEADPLPDDVQRAVLEWLAARDRDLVPVRVSRRSVTLRPPAG